MRDDVYVYLRNDLPPHIHEMVSPNADGSYTIILNARLNYESQLKAYNHAFDHIKNGDFDIDNAMTVQEIEARAHGLVSGNDFVKAVKKKRRRESAKVSFLKKHGYDFFSAAERNWLDPK